MKNIQLKINGKPTEIKDGTTILDAAKQLKITIPTMCHQNGHVHFTSCMICIVKENRTGKLLPACSALVAEGMDVETDSAEVRDARKTALELLLSEHVGDCNGPCKMTCPANMDIPRMLTQIETGQIREALITVKEHIALPAVLGRICPAPCEKGCRRAQVDQALAICLLKRFVADEDLKSASPYIPKRGKASGKKIAIAGTGPTGLAAAYYLLRDGHDCVLFDSRKETGGAMRQDISDLLLPRKVLDEEIDIIRKMGAEFKMGQTVGKDIAIDKLRKEYDAVVLATGPMEVEAVTDLGLESTKTGILINGDTYMTSLDGVFAGGSALRPVRMAVKSVAQGKDIAEAVALYLQKKEPVLPARRFNSRIGKLMESEKTGFLTGSQKDNPDQDQKLNENKALDISQDQAALESSRCLHCECLKPDNCKLRDYSEDYQASQSQYKSSDRAQLEKVDDHPHVIYEPGKCIKCGLCVRITEAQKENLGLTFIGRGFDVRIGVPLNRTLDKALEKTAETCVETCPTGALAYRPKI